MTTKELLHRVLDWLRACAASARYMTAVCTGSLVLAKAGLLAGRKATCHWNYVDLLPRMGAVYEPGRVVVDGDRITGGGVTAGIDFAPPTQDWVAGDHAPEDSFYLWGPAVPEWFVINTETTQN